MSLSAGSIAFVGFNADNPDAIAFVALDPIAAGQVIHFSDNEANAAGNGFVDNNEGSLTWTASSAVAVGTVVEILGGNAAGPTASTGTVTRNNNFDLAGGGDTLYAFVGTSATLPTAFLSAVTNFGAFTAANGGLANTGLTGGATALALPATADIAVYDQIVAGAFVTSFASKALAQTAFNTAGNFRAQDGAGDQAADGIAPDAPFRANPPLQGVTFTIGGGAPPTPTVSIAPATLTLVEGNSGATAFAFTVSRSAVAAGDALVPVTLTGGAGFDAADIASVLVNGAAVAGFAVGTPFDVALSGSALSATVTVNIAGDAAAEANETFTLALSDPGAAYDVAAGVGSATGTVTNDDVALTAISAVQGAGRASPLVGQTVTVEGVVTGDYQNGDGDASRNLQGFYVQMLVGDGDAATSDGVFVFQSDGAASPVTNVRVGDVVRVTGVVREQFTETQIRVEDSATGISVVEAGRFAEAQVLSAFAQDVNLPATGTVTAGGRVLPDLENVEGMLIRLPQPLTITEGFNLDRFGEIRVAQGPQAVQFTQNNLPDVDDYREYLQELGARSLLIDDGLNTQNPNPITLLGRTFDTATAPQIGDTISGGLIGNLGFGFNEYRLQPANSPAILDTQPREPAPGRDGGTLKVASANLLNYFVTLDTPGALTGPTGNQQAPRGANTAAEFARQEQKLLTALFDLDADVLVLNEVENNGFVAGSAIRRLADQLDLKYDANGRAEADWTFVDPGAPFLGGDAISVGILYRADKVALAAGSNVAVLDDTDIPALVTAGLLPSGFLEQSTIDRVFNGPDTSRAVLVASLTEIASGETFGLAAVHNKSKAGAGTGADADQGDGAGAWNQQRLLAAQALDAFLKSNPTGIADPDKLLLGDFNSYAREPSIAFLTGSAAYNNLIEERIGPDAFSFVFDGQRGYLDHALASDSVEAFVRGVHEWHANSTEFDALDYNLDFGRSASLFDGATPWRYSDHDPVVVNLLLGAGLVLSRGGVQLFPSDSFAETGTRAQTGDTIAVRNGARVTDGANAVLTVDDLTVALGSTNGFVFSFGADLAANSATFTGTGGFTFNGDARQETVVGNDGANVLNGGAGDDSLLGGGGDDVLDGGAGNDLMDGGAGVDTASYALAPIGVRVNLGLSGPQRTFGPDFDTLLNIENVTGSAFNDSLIGTAGDNVILGGAGDDRIAGLGGADRLDGGAGNDDVRGGAGEQEIRGGDGNDFVFGGAGADRFVFDLDDGSDRIGDFLRAQGDKIVLVGGGGAAALSFAGSSFTYGLTEVRLLNAPPLLASDFLFS